MFYVYYGHVNSDNHDRYPTHRLVLIANKERVVQLKKEFDECSHDDCSNVEFVVIEGKQLSIIPKTFVTDWVIE